MHTRGVVLISIICAKFPRRKEGELGAIVCTSKHIHHPILVNHSTITPLASWSTSSLSQWSRLELHVKSHQRGVAIVFPATRCWFIVAGCAKMECIYPVNVKGAERVSNRHHSSPASRTSCCQPRGFDSGYYRIVREGTEALAEFLVEIRSIAQYLQEEWTLQRTRDLGGLHFHQ